MTQCPCPELSADREPRAMCPLSGTRGSAVHLNTVKALLTERALRRVSGSPHRFCADPRCDVVYFDTADQMFRVSDLRVGVWQKQPFGKRMICYCFGENERAMRRERGRSRAVERVRAQISAGRCACEVRNPLGTCCLADIIAAVQRIESRRHELPDR